MAPLDVHILDWHRTAHASLYILFCFSQIEIPTAPWIHLSLPGLCCSNFHFHLPKCSSVPEGLDHKVFNDIPQNNIISNYLMQPVCNSQHTYFWFTSHLVFFFFPHLVLLSCFVLLDSSAREQNLFFFVFNCLPHLLA